MVTMMFRKLLISGLCLSSLVLAGCSSSSSGGTSTTFSITPSLGVVVHATVKLFQSDGTTEMGSGDTGADGTVDITYTGTYSGPIIVAIVGDADAEYYDEASGTMVAFPAGNPLRAILASGTTQATVTALTEVAYQLSLVNSIALTDDIVNQLNERVREALASELTSILTPPTMFDSSTSGGGLADNEAGKYALRLAALAQLGAADASPALTLATQLAQDMADGTLDGQHSGTPVTGLLYTPGTFVSDLTAHIATLANSYGSGALQAAIDSYSVLSPSVDFSDLLGGGSGGGLGGGSGGLPGSVAGEVVTMVYCCQGAGSAYSNGDEVLFTFSSSDSLMLTDQYTVVATSFTQRNAEYVWVDSTNSREYALTLHNGEINKVNVTGIGGSPFYGQFTPVTTGGTGGSGGGSSLTPDGAGAALSGGNGATGTVDGTVYTYTGGGSSQYVYLPQDDSIYFSAFDGASVITFWRLNGVPAAVGTYSCESGGLAVMLTINGLPNLADECTIEVTSVSGTEVEGRFAANLMDSNDASFGSVTDGYFRYSVPVEAGTDGLEAGQFGYSMDVDGENVTVTDVPALDGFDSPAANYLSLGDAPDLQLRMIPYDTTGHYVCGEGPAFREVALWYFHGNTYYYSDNSSHTGSCSIEITSVGAEYEGTFSGTLYTNTGTALTITNGVFRNDGSAL